MKTPLKSGDDVTYPIGGQTLVLTPMPWGKLKKVFAMFAESASVVSGDLTNNPSKFMKWISELLTSQADDFLLLLFDPKKNEFLNREWIEDNLTLTQIQQIIADSIAVNGVADFLAKKGGMMSAKVSDNSQKAAVAS